MMQEFDPFFKNLPITRVKTDPLTQAFDMLNETKYSPIPTPVAAAQPQTQAKAAPSTQAAEAGTGKTSPLDGSPRGLVSTISHLLLGVDSDSLTPEDRKKEQARNSDAAAMSKSAATDPGESFMGIPTPDNKKGLLQSLIGLFA